MKIKRNLEKLDKFAMYCVRRNENDIKFYNQENSELQKRINENLVDIEKCRYENRIIKNRIV